VADGTVKWFNAARGFGMIVPDELTANVFVHFSSIERSGRRELTEGQRVTFDAELGPKGPRTTRVRPLEVDGRPPAPLGGEDTD
jgi:CspA family cold shock protein